MAYVRQEVGLCPGDRLGLGLGRPELRFQRLLVADVANDVLPLDELAGVRRDDGARVGLEPPHRSILAEHPVLDPEVRPGRPVLPVRCEHGADALDVVGMQEADDRLAHEFLGRIAEDAYRRGDILDEAVAAVGGDDVGDVLGEGPVAGLAGAEGPLRRDGVGHVPEDGLESPGLPILALEHARASFEPAVVPRLGAGRGGRSDGRTPGQERRRVGADRSPASARRGMRR